MPRETFQQELNDLVEKVIGLGVEVEGSLESMVGAIESRDARLGEKEIGVDIRYKARGTEIESDSMIVQARQAPVARDLRLLYTMQSVDEPLRTLRRSHRAHLPRPCRHRGVRARR
jgi:phosphate transport system protein